MPGDAPPGTPTGIGLAGNEASVTFVKPAVRDVESHAMLYWSGVPVVAVYGRFTLVAEPHTTGKVPNVMVGDGFTVTDRLEAELLPQALPAVTCTAPEPAV